MHSYYGTIPSGGSSKHGFPAGSTYGKVDPKKNGNAGGGLWASFSGSPMAWLGAFLLFCVVFSTAVWVTLDSLGGSSSDSNVDVEVVDSASVFGSRPHIIFVLADDLGWNSIGYEDFDLSFATPTLTSLAQEGIIMDTFYAQEVCTPARAALLTGRLPLTVGMQYSMVQTALPWGLDLAETTLAEVLRDDNYSTHMLGKWHLGHYSPRMIPTARGFQSFTGFLNGENYYWSKRNPDHTTFHDLMYSTEECYYAYDKDDMHTYSTFFYRDKAKDIIKSHDSSKSSLFLFLSFQAVHDPFVDINIHQNGIPKDYLEESVYDEIIATVKGRKRRQYAMSLNLLDSAVSEILESLQTYGMMDNSVVIFSSDNGGCYGAGGKNGPLRGTKGSLFEGGTKVDSFMWSPLLPDAARGKLYTNMFHIADWFPTILAITGTSFTPAQGYDLDGVNHLPAILDGESSPREYMLYNFYYNVDYYDFDMWINGSFAVRNEQFKLMHTYNSSIYAVWYQPEDLNSDDDAITTETRCAASSNKDGDFTYWLFDLINDPYETTNLFDSTGPLHKAAKEELYAVLQTYANNSYEMTYDFQANRHAFKVWKEHGNYIVPYTNSEDLEKAKGTYPEDCFGQIFSDSNETDDIAEATTPSPSLAPSLMIYPTVAPTITEEFDSSSTSIPSLDPTSSVVYPSDNTASPTATQSPTDPSRPVKEYPTDSPSNPTVAPSYAVPTRPPTINPLISIPSASSPTASTPSVAAPNSVLSPIASPVSPISSPILEVVPASPVSPLLVPTLPTLPTTVSTPLLVAPSSLNIPATASNKAITSPIEPPASAADTTDTTSMRSQSSQKFR